MTQFCLHSPATHHRPQAILTAAGYLAFLWVPLRPPANVSLLGTAFGFIKHLATADVLLTVGHWAMHAPRFQYLRKSHHLHHSSWAIVSISGYYMSVLDAFLEHFTITISFLLWGELGGFMPTAFTVGAFNVLVTHSGWDIWFLPDPKKHYLHHVRARWCKVFWEGLAGQHAETTLHSNPWHRVSTVFLASSHAPMATDVPVVLPKPGGSIMIPMCASCLRLHLILVSHYQVI